MVAGVHAPQDGEAGGSSRGGGTQSSLGCAHGPKFTERGEIGVSLRVTRDDSEDAQLTFVIWDTGIGIPVNRIGALFEPFIQADSSTTRKFGGSGLGLNIARQLAVIMGGSIEVTSESGRRQCGEPEGRHSLAAQAGRRGV